MPLCVQFNSNPFACWMHGRVAIVHFPFSMKIPFIQNMIRRRWVLCPLSLIHCSHICLMRYFIINKLTGRFEISQRSMWMRMHYFCNVHQTLGVFSEQIPAQNTNTLSRRWHNCDGLGIFLFPVCLLFVSLTPHHSLNSHCACAFVCARTP